MIATKLYMPPLRSNVVQRPRLLDRLNAILSAKLALWLVVFGVNERRWKEQAGTV